MQVGEEPNQQAGATENGQTAARQAAACAGSRPRRRASANWSRSGLTLSRRAGQLVAAIWMRLPQVSSKTAVVTGPMFAGCWTNFTLERAQPVELGLHIIDGERGVRDTVGDDRVFERLHRRVVVRFENQLDAVGILRRHHGQPLELTDRHLGLLHKAQRLGVEAERLVLVVDEDAGEIDLHFFSLGRHRSAMRSSGAVSR